ncbi:hypothetical protein BC939DRAFT_440659 [Gamsiella multidivaricata]|uniref:uncharacterized protein n=1 Tax=Gamsiella multidivaricata TaxID=101098 RepID=UPI00221ECD16|nr:uncharacterized protein BC939DRAFT_440659 [Gamsiella multidivaricata]KAG0367166.1 hypothetical protein BGZ54_004310 [Gamsiella multidivaricata]KAI7829803.1 hypothetical protein BC939DRAFT_440659 [Gamsiella multidivaricata]
MAQHHHVRVFICIWLACLAVLNQSVFAADTVIQDGVPMKSIPIHLMPRSYAGRKRTLGRFQPKNTIELRFIDAEKGSYYGACHHVDMDVELKSDDGSKTIQALNPFAFQNAVKSISCSAGSSQLQLELDPEYAQQARRWKLSPATVFGVIIPHDFVDLKKNKACYDDLSSTAKKWAQDHPMETVVKLVKNIQFLDSKNPNIVSFRVVRTDVWSQMNRAQSVKIAHKPMDEMLGLYFHKRSTAVEDGPMWDYEHNLASATENVASQIPADNVDANLDNSSVKGYAQANMAWKQICIKNIFNGQMKCANWGISESKISGMTQINHQAQLSVKSKLSVSTLNNSKNNSQPLLTLTNINVTTPGFDLMAPIPLLGFSVPGVFDMGASIGLGGSVSLAVLVRATQDLLVNTGSTTSCPWVIQWSGSFANFPTVQFGTCTMPGTPKVAAAQQDVLSRKSSETALYFGADPASSHNEKRALTTAPGSRETATVRVGVTVSPSLGMALKVFGFTALSAGISSPISLGVNTYWDTDKTETCPANHVALHADGTASLQVNAGFFGFNKGIPLVQGPTLTSPKACIPH